MQCFNLGVRLSVTFQLENAIAANPAVRFYILLFISLVSCIVLAMIWVGVAGGDDDHEATNDPASALFMAFQVLITGSCTNCFFSHAKFCV